jgi:hypothetical protein
MQGAGGKNGPNNVCTYEQMNTKIPKNKNKNIH